MAAIPSNLSRVSNNLRTSIATGNLTRTQVGLLKVQNQLATGKRLSNPSDDPGAAAAIQSIRKTLEQRDGFLKNLQAAGNHLGAVDSTLADVSDLLNEAQQIASANVGSDVTPEARTAAAAVIDRIYSQLLSLGNRQVEGVYLFAGDRSTAPPFEEAGGGVKFVATRNVLENDFDENATLPFTVNGDSVFGAFSTRVKGITLAAPTVGAGTRLADLKGAIGEGIRKGQLALSNGTTTTTIDLTKADTLGDVIDRINAAAVGGITAALGGDGVSIALTGGGGDNISVNEVGGGAIAADLGILQPTGGGAGSPVAGANLAAQITPLTTLASLRGGTGIDTSGFTITNGLVTKTVDLSAAVTVQDMLNAINGAGVNVLAEINETGDGINLLNPTQGISLTIAENGGQTAAQLGLRSYASTSPLSQLNFGKGVRTVDGDDLLITDSAGVTFGVDVDGAATIQDVLNRITTQAIAAGAGVSATFATTGNGIVLTDTAAGGGVLAVGDTPFSKAADDLGLNQPASAGVITGSDVNAVQSQGLFANMIALQNALRTSDQSAITAAAEKIKGDYDRTVQVRGEAGARLQELESRRDRIADQNIATRKLLSEVEDVDFTEAITRFQTLQTALQASLQTAGSTLNLSLLDFLA
ncbi:MAG TPA: flagellar hook-associated protein FlgL [Tepidisphaeraceae bacterium]|nr:flagellar hook-associated protein FlgL [Tepidisphaeraceae bacterium]